MAVTVIRVHGRRAILHHLEQLVDSLPRDRERRGPREMAPDKNPAWPRFKYNDFKVLDFGMRIRIDMRYFPDDDSTLSTTDRQAHKFVPMISGPISDMRFTFSERDGARLEVCGEDDLCILKNKNPKKGDYWARPEKEIIDDVLKRANFPLKLARPKIPWPTFADSEARALAEAHFEGQSYLEYLMKFAERWDFEIFIDYVSLDDGDLGLEFHFEPCRCRTRPDKTFRDVYIVERGENQRVYVPVKIK
jgi:hypothetical protein